MLESAALFWHWFELHEADVRRAYAAGDTKWLDTHLSPRIALIVPRMNWEIGPYALPDNALVLSPATRHDLSTVKAVVAIAPTVKGWRFIACKPPKELLSLEFEFKGTSTNADLWVYRMTSYGGGEFVDLEIFFDPSSAPPVGTEDVLCELVVEALVGEELRLDRIGRISAHTVPEVQAIERTTAIEWLRPQLLEVLKVCH